MDSKRLKQVEEFYNAALGLEPDARGEFLDRACAGDESLRLEVLSLLDAAEREDSFLGEPVVDLALAVLGTEDTSWVGKMIGPFQLLSLIGRGGMAEVYLAHDSRLNRRVAIKMLPITITTDRERVLRFEQEARAASAITHPNVARVYTVGEEDGRRYIMMEYVAGMTLRQALKGEPLLTQQALDIAAQVTAALAAAHAIGIVHRDIKPENIMLQDDGVVKVLDFGLAKFVGVAGLAKEPVPSLQTGPDVLMGTYDYMSPEQLRRHPVDERTDLWSLGVVLYEMLMGRRPFAADSVSEVIVSVLEREPLGEPDPSLPAPLRRLVAKALMKRPEERYQSAKEFADELRRVKEELVKLGPDFRGRPDA